MGIRVFMSYATEDMDAFQIAQIAAWLKRMPGIGEVLYWQEEAHGNISDYMDKSIGSCDVFLLFCSHNALDSSPVRVEWGAALNLGKPIIPIFRNPDNIPPILRQMRGIPFALQNLPSILAKLYSEILEVTRMTEPSTPSSEPPNPLDPEQILPDLVLNRFYMGVVRVSHDPHFFKIRGELLEVRARLQTLLALDSRAEELPKLLQLQGAILTDLRRINETYKNKLKALVMAQYEELHRVRSEIQRDLKALQGRIQKINSLNKGESK